MCWRSKDIECQRHRRAQDGVNDSLPETLHGVGRVVPPATTVGFVSWLPDPLHSAAVGLDHPNREQNIKLLGPELIPFRFPDVCGEIKIVIPPEQITAPALYFEPKSRECWFDFYIEGSSEEPSELLLVTLLAVHPSTVA